MAETTPTGLGLADTVVRVIGPFLPGIAGSVIGMMIAEGLTTKGRVISLLTGLACAVLVAPALVGMLEAFWPWGKLEGDLLGNVEKAIVFLTGLFGMALLSGLAHALAKYSRDPLKLVRIQAGPLTIGGSNDGAAQ